MPRCQYCGEKVDEDVVFCPKCGEALVEEDMKRQGLQVQEKVDEARDRANMYVILATVLVTVGLMGSSLFLVSSSLLGFFGIAFVCLGIGCTASADRYKRKATSLKNQLSDKAS